jgi:transcriptional regulator with XRE-family HTH domain
MTIKEIADLCKVERRTVQNWMAKVSEKDSKVLEKITKARETSIAASFTLEETIAIIRAGGNDTLADLLAENAKKVESTPTRAKLPNGKQMEQYRIMAERGLITKDQLHIVLGLATGQTQPTVIYRDQITRRPELSPPDRQPEKVEQVLRGVMPKEDKNRTAVFGVAKRLNDKEESKRTIDKLNGKLDLGADHD